MPDQHNQFPPSIKSITCAEQFRVLTKMTTRLLGAPAAALQGPQTRPRGHVAGAQKVPVQSVVFRRREQRVLLTHNTFGAKMLQRGRNGETSGRTATYLDTGQKALQHALSTMVAGWQRTGWSWPGRRAGPRGPRCRPWGASRASTPNTTTSASSIQTSAQRGRAVRRPPSLPPGSPRRAGRPSLECSWDLRPCRDPWTDVPLALHTDCSCLRTHCSEIGRTVVLERAPFTVVVCTSLRPLPSVSMNILTTQNQALPYPVVQSSIEIEAALPRYLDPPKQPQNKHPPNVQRSVRQGRERASSPRARGTSRREQGEERRAGAG